MLKKINLKVILFGFIFTFFSSFGQSFFLGLFNAPIRTELNITHGQFGNIYAAATIFSSLLLIWVGKKIEIGDSILEVFKRTQRCAATNVNPENALRDINIPNEINSHFGHLDLGVYAKVKKTGVISVNDKLSLN